MGQMFGVPGRSVALAVTVGLLALGAPLKQAEAQRTKTSWAGMLSCKIAGGGSFVVGSSRKLSCVYKPSRGRAERYRGRINRYGVDIGPVKSGVLAWQVFAPGTGKKGPGRLAGRFVGYGAQAAVGVGGGYNVLYSLNNFSLNPYSVQGIGGVNAAAGVASLRLTYAGR